GAAVSFVGFYVILAWGRAPLGRISLLTYNVSVLYAYSIAAAAAELARNKGDSDDDDDGDEGQLGHPLIMEIVKHRVIAVGAGILWGLFICRVVWPIPARRKFKEGMAMLYLQMGLIWKRGPLSVLLRSGRTKPYLRSGEQVALQRYGMCCVTL